MVPRDVIPQGSGHPNSRKKIDFGSEAIDIIPENSIIKDKNNISYSNEEDEMSNLRHLILENEDKAIVQKSAEKLQDILGKGFIKKLATNIDSRDSLLSLIEVNNASIRKCGLHICSIAEISEAIASITSKDEESINIKYELIKAEYEIYKYSSIIDDKKDLLAWACEYETLDCVEIIIKCANRYLFNQSLIYGAISNIHGLPILDYLFKEGLNVDGAMNDKGKTPLEYAAATEEYFAKILEHTSFENIHILDSLEEYPEKLSLVKRRILEENVKAQLTESKLTYNSIHKFCDDLVREAFDEYKNNPSENPEEAYTRAIGIIKDHFGGYSILTKKEEEEFKKEFLKPFNHANEEHKEWNNASVLGKAGIMTRKILIPVGNIFRGFKSKETSMVNKVIKEMEKTITGLSEEKKIKKEYNRPSKKDPEANLKPIANLQDQLNNAASIGNIEVMRSLIKRGAQLTQDIIYSGVKNGHLNVLEEFFDKKAVINQSIIDAAMEAKDPEILRMVLDKAKLNENALIELHTQAKLNHPDKLKLLEEILNLGNKIIYSNLKEKFNNEINELLPGEANQNLRNQLTRNANRANDEHLQKALVLLDLFSKIKKIDPSIDMSEIFKGGHVVIKDEKIYDYMMATGLFNDRTSSHYKIDKGNTHKINGKSDASLIAGKIFNEFVIGVKKGDNGKFETWFQLEGHSHHRDPSAENIGEKLWNSTIGRIYTTNKFLHHIDFIKYKFVHGKQKNIGQYGNSSHTETNNPITVEKTVKKESKNLEEIDSLCSAIKAQDIRNIKFILRTISGQKRLKEELDNDTLSKELATAILESNNIKILILCLKNDIIRKKCGQQLIDIYFENNNQYAISIIKNTSIEAFKKDKECKIVGVGNYLTGSSKANNQIKAKDIKIQNLEKFESNYGPIITTIERENIRQQNKQSSEKPRRNIRSGMSMEEFISDTKKRKKIVNVNNNLLKAIQKNDIKSLKLLIKEIHYGMSNDKKFNQNNIRIDLHKEKLKPIIDAVIQSNNPKIVKEILGCNILRKECGQEIIDGFDQSQNKDMVQVIKKDSLNRHHNKDNLEGNLLFWHDSINGLSIKDIESDLAKIYGPVLTTKEREEVEKIDDKKQKIDKIIELSGYTSNKFQGRGG